MHFRFATPDDADLLAGMNHSLIQDEGHRNRMTPQQLAARMSDWLQSDYRAVVFEIDGQPRGFVLFREEEEYVYLRQLYVVPECRRQGIGRTAIEWLRTNAFSDDRRVRVEALIGNTTAIDFWRAAGFQDYCLTLELDRPEST